MADIRDFRMIPVLLQGKTESPRKQIPTMVSPPPPPPRSFRAFFCEKLKMFTCSAVPELGEKDSELGIY